MRIIIRGISKENIDSWNDKFKSFRVSDCYFSPEKSFLFCTVDDSDHFISTFHGIKWKGDVLQVEKSIFPKFCPGSQVVTPNATPIVTHNVAPIVTQDATQVVTQDKSQEKEVENGWKIGKFNRKIAVFKTRDPKSRKLKVINPENYKNNYFRFNQKDYKSKSISDLSWPKATTSDASDSSLDESDASDVASRTSLVEPMSGIDDIKENMESKVVINTESLRSLVFPSHEPKLLFDFGISQDPVEKEEKVQVIKSLSKTTLFFLHMDSENDRSVWNRQLFKRLFYFLKIRVDGNYKREWEEKRQEYTMLFKKRHKDATRRRSRYFNKNRK